MKSINVIGSLLLISTAIAIVVLFVFFSNGNYIANF